MGATNQDGIELRGLPLDAAAESTTITGRDLPAGCPYDWVRVESQSDEFVFRVRVRAAFESWEIQIPTGPGAHEGGVEDAWIQDPGGYEDEPLADWVAVLLEAIGVGPSVDWHDLTAGGGQ